MFRHGGRRPRPRYVDEREDLLALYARQGVEDSDPDSDPESDDEGEGPPFSPGPPFSRPPGLPSLRPLPGNPAFSNPGFGLTASPASTTILQSTTTATAEVTSTVSVPPSIIVDENPSPPVPPPLSSSSTRSSSSTAPSSTPISIPPAQPTKGPNLPIALPTTLQTSITRPTSSETTSSTPLPTPVADGAGNPDAGQAAASVDAPGASGLKPGAQAGVAMGTIAGFALFASLFFFLWKRYQVRKARDAVIRDSTRSEPPPTQARAQDPRTDSQILDDLMAQAYAHQNGGGIPTGYVVSSDEKKQNGTVVTILDGAPPPGHQPEIRSSIASWLRRHHPLQLNPMSANHPGYPASPLGSPRITTPPRSPNPPIPSPTPSPRQPKQPDPSRLKSVWSNSSGVTSDITSDGNTNSIIGLYGQASGSPTDVTSEEPGRNENRASSPVLGHI